MAKLKTLVIDRKMPPGRYGDGGGLYLLVGPTGSKSWVFRYKVNRVERAMGLGPYPTVTLADARKKAEHCRRLRAERRDPLAEAAAERERAKIEAARATTFKQCADAYLAVHEAGWKNPKHRQQWRNTLETYAYPVIGSLPVQTVDVPLLLKILQPLWATKTVTAGRVRSRIEAILDWAKVNKYREGENPARWRGNLDQALPKPSKVHRVKHHPALPYTEAPAFLVRLRQRKAIAALACEFLILTAGRTSPVLDCKWQEIDELGAVWTVPAEKMKSDRDHRVPLSKPALAILEQMKRLRRDEYVFPGNEKNAPLSNMAILTLLHRMGRSDITGHGFRSTFKDWTAECTNFANEVSEMALAHVVGDKVEAAYRRGVMFEKRRRLMEAWAQYCTASARPRSTAEIVQLTAVAA